MHIYVNHLYAHFLDGLSSFTYYFFYLFYLFLFVQPSKLDEVLALKQSGKLPDLKHIIVSPPLSAMYYETQTSHPQPDDSVHDLSTLLQQASPIFHPIETHMDDPALIIYTSGTTGSPKGALHAHRTLLGHLSGVEFPQEFFPRQGDLFWTPADWAWIGGLIDVLLPSLHHGIPVLANRFKKFDADLAFRTIEKFSVRNMFLPPTALKLMRQGVDHPEKKYKLNVRSIGSGGESLGESLLDWGKTTFGVNINEFYGQTECNLVLGNNSIFPCVPGSMGRPMPGHIVKIVDDEGHELEKGRIGNIAIKSPDPVMFLRYWNKPEATQDKFRNNFLLTGDLGKEDDKGYFWFFGRNVSQHLRERKSHRAIKRNKKDVSWFSFHLADNSIDSFRLFLLFLFAFFTPFHLALLFFVVDIFPG